jgi:AcrR family transcriptional regulator
MPKPRLSREESRRQTRDRLLVAAAQVFADQGFNGASVEAIAEAAGYSKGAVYSNFDSKEDLFLALIDQQLAAEIEHLGDRIDLAAWRREFESELGQQRTLNLLTVEFFLYAMRNESARAKLAQRYQTARQLLAKMLQEHYAEAGLPLPMPPLHLAWAMTAVGTGLFMETCIDPEGVPDDLYVSSLKRLLYADSMAAEDQPD